MDRIGSQAALPQNHAAAEGKKRKWTILAYIGADNNLETFMLDTLLQMERVGSSEDVAMLAQIDRRTLPESPPVPPELKDDPEILEDWKKKLEKMRLNFDGDWTTTRRYCIVKGADQPTKIEKDTDRETATMEFLTDRIASPVVQDLGETNMGEPGVLKDFLQWGISNYPAEHYMLILADHGNAYLGCMNDESPRNILSLPDLHKAIEEVKCKTGEKLDIIGFNACLMGTAETAYQLRNDADILIGSEELENAPGWPTAEILATMVEGNRDAAMTPEDVAKMMVKKSSTLPFEMPTLSAVNLKKMEPVKEAVNQLGSDLLKKEISSYYLRKSITQSLHFGDMALPPEGDHVDIGDLCEQISQSEKIATPEITRDCEELSKSVREALIAFENCGEKMEHAHGLSLYAPTSRMRYNPFASRNPLSGHYDEEGKFSYRNLDFSKDNKWEELLRTKFK